MLCERVSDDNSEFVFGRYRAADAGTFTCLASNDAGNASVDLHLTVYGLCHLSCRQHCNVSMVYLSCKIAHKLRHPQTKTQKFTCGGALLARGLFHFPECPRWQPYHSQRQGQNCQDRKRSTTVKVTTKASLAVVTVM